MLPQTKNNKACSAAFKLKFVRLQWVYITQCVTDRQLTQLLDCILGLQSRILVQKKYKKTAGKASGYASQATDKAEKMLRLALLQCEYALQ